MKLGQGIMEHGAGHPMQRVTLLKKLSLADNPATRNLFANSSKYAITSGGRDADEIKLTDSGKMALDPDAPARQRTQARFELSIKAVEPFFKLYDRFKGGKLPAPEVMRDALAEIDQGDRQQCVDIFVSNAGIVGLLQTREGAQHLLTIERYLDELPSSGALGRSAFVTKTETSGLGDETASTVSDDFDRVCFFIAPIGSDDSEQRQHSDAILSSFVEPAITEHKLSVIRADKISKPGMISAQVIEYILRSKLVVADLSYHNPNVFYELALRHATGKPTVHLIREADKIPFDVGNFRTIPIKMDCVFAVLAKLETYRSEIAQQIRQVLADGVTTNNPILAFCPNGRFVLNGE